MAELRFPNEGSIPEFLAALASPDDTHGALTAAAVAGAMGASLLQKVCDAAQTLPSADDELTARVRAAAALARGQEELLKPSKRKRRSSCPPPATCRRPARRSAQTANALSSSRFAPQPTYRWRSCDCVSAHCSMPTQWVTASGSVNRGRAGRDAARYCFQPRALHPRGQAPNPDRRGARDVDWRGDRATEPRRRCCGHGARSSVTLPPT
jgi:hypothetical protein